MIRSVFDSDELAFRDEVEAMLEVGPTPARGFYEGRGGTPETCTGASASADG